MDKLVCVGKNYLEHAKELGDAVPERPVLFLKPPSVLLQAGAGQDSLIQAPLPPERGDVHHECEIVVRLNRGGENLSVHEAEQAIGEVTLGLDMTLREVQGKLKKAGAPWEISKVFRGSALVGPWVPASEFPDWQTEEFSFTLDGNLRQKGRASEMRLSVAECIAYASEHFPLVAGDLIFTGTPAGVGPVRAGQRGELRWGSRVRCAVQWK